MRSYINQPTLFYDFLKPSSFVVDVAGGATDGGRNGGGQSISMDTSGGGFITHTMTKCFIQDREEHEYINWLGARCNRSFRFINVPIKTDWMGPFPTLDRWPVPIIDHIPHSDGALFSDDSGYSQATVWGELTEDVGVGAGVISIRVYGASRPLRWSDWFSIYHSNNGASSKGWRAYRYWEVQGVTDEVNPIYTVATEIPIREATPAGTRVEFARPLCVMKFAPGFTLPWEVQGFWRSSPTIQFVEAF